MSLPLSSLRSFVTRPYQPGADAGQPPLSCPKLTVVTPSYNQVGYLERTILSVLNQHYPNLEYLIIDGGSTDGSVELINQYEPYLAGWVSEQDRGQTDAINKGFQRATGDYVAFQNSDDVFAPDALANLAAAWRKYPDTDVFFGDMYIIDEEDVILEELRTLPFCPECQIYEGMQVFNQSLFIRRGLLEEAGLLDESLRFVIDYEIIARLGVRKDVKFRRVENFWGGFRIQPDAKTATIGSIGRSEHARIRQQYGPLLTSKLGERFWRVYCRVRKMAGFAFRGEWKYIRHRYQLSRARN